MTKKHFILIIICSFLYTIGYAQNGRPYHIFNKKGKKVSFKNLKRKAKKSEIILFGEQHNNPIAHWLQLKLAKDISSSKTLMLGMEMIESDNQQVLNDYLKGKIDTRKLDTLARLWSNHKTDYAPIIDFAKMHDIPIIATNVPRKYASRVYREGGFEILENLSSEEKSFIAPLPIAFDPNLPRYKNILKMMEGHATIDLVKAQALKDATMAHFILNSYKNGNIFLHLNGAYHSDFYEGILWYLKQDNDTLKYMTISTVEQDNIQRLESEFIGSADFIICVDADMTKSY